MTQFYDNRPTEPPDEPECPSCEECGLREENLKDLFAWCFQHWGRIAWLPSKDGLCRCFLQPWDGISTGEAATPHEALEKLWREHL